MIAISRPPYLLRKMYPKCVWRMPSGEKKVYLTFDDGPVPEVTPFVLDVLKQYKVGATFFCVGENVSRHPDIYERVLADGHKTANHTYNHIKGLFHRNTSYYSNVSKCAEVVDSKLFRPPYGQLKISQHNDLSRKYRIIMWDVLSCDYSSAISPEKCLRNVTEKTRDGSIIVFHDSKRAFRNMEYALPRSIAFLQQMGYCFSLL